MKDYQIAALVVSSILINYLGKYLADTFTLPLWLDAVGTVLTALYLGPVCGAIVGATVNIIYGLQDSLAFAYLPVSILTGVITGVAARHGRFENFFGVTTVGAAIAVVSTLLSTPLNYYFNHGYTGNIWGDGIIRLLHEWLFPPAICYLTGEFYIDFPDKLLTTLLVFAMAKILDKKLQLRNTVLAVFFIFMLGASFSGTGAYAAAGEGVINYNSYVQTVYGSGSGLLGGAANAIATTKDGLLWVGTYGGLYRYNGTEFKKMAQLNSVKNVNCLFVDEEGRLWIGTNDDGLSICINQQIANVIDESMGLPSNSVRAISFSSDGLYYVGTSDALCIISLSAGIDIYKTLPEIKYAKRLAADSKKNAVAVTDAGELYLLRQGEIADRLTADRSSGYVYTSCAFAENGRLYVGTSSNVIECFEIQSNRLISTGSIVCEGLKQLNDVSYDESGKIFVCSDFGVGYICNDQFYPINTNNFHSSIDNMVTDYQGNLWFASSRQGLLRLCHSPFTDLYSEAGLEPQVVNSVVKWNDRIYFGTDNGLDVIDFATRTKAEDSISALLAKVRIRSLMVDSHNHLWICTSGNGAYEVRTDGSYTAYTADMGMQGNRQRNSLQLSDGAIAIAGDSGISFIKDGKIIAVVGKEQGLSNTKILTMTELSKGRIAAGSDGAGIFIIDNYRVTDNIKKTDGLYSNVILRTIKLNDELLVITTSGLCLIDNEYDVTKIHNFPYNNNFDIVTNQNKLWVLGGAGIYIVDRERLLNDTLQDYELLDAKQGLRGAITANAWNYTDDAGNLYICGDSGVNVINLQHYNDSRRSYRLSVKSISVDGVRQRLSVSDVANIPRGSTRLEIFPEIINYSINNPYVMYYLEGFDDDYTIVPQSELTSVVYTNLPSKKYVFHLAVMDDKDGKIIEKLSYVINKEKEIYDNTWFLVYATVVFVLVIIWLTWFIVRTQVQRTINLKNKELALVKRQLELGNETVMAIARTVDAKDENTSQHAFRVSKYSVMIARRLGYDEKACENLRIIALLHDIGKIGIPDSVLNKPERLTEEEYALMKSHVIKGGEILKDFTLIENVSEGALYHHERYDGTGYVHGLKGEEIPLNARIIGIADAFDAMTANRIYRKQVNLPFVISEIKKGRGTQFDPKLVDIMLELIETGEIDIRSIYGEEAD